MKDTPVGAGFGWFQRDYKGKLTLFHRCGVDGAHATSDLVSHTSYTGGRLGVRCQQCGEVTYDPRVVAVFGAQDPLEEACQAVVEAVADFFDRAIQMQQPGEEDEDEETPPSEGEDEELPSAVEEETPPGEEEKPTEDLPPTEEEIGHDHTFLDHADENEAPEEGR